MQNSAQKSVQRNKTLRLHRPSPNSTIMSEIVPISNQLRASAASWPFADGDCVDLRDVFGPEDNVGMSAAVEDMPGMQPASLVPASGVAQAPGAFPKLAAPLNANHITNPAMSRFKRLARGGGNMSGVTTSMRTVKEFRVNINEEGVALWLPKDSYAVQITILVGHPGS